MACEGGLSLGCNVLPRHALERTQAVPALLRQRAVRA
jgi:hypothetical protein